MIPEVQAARKLFPELLIPQPAPSPMTSQWASKTQSQVIYRQDQGGEGERLVLINMGSPESARSRERGSREGRGWTLRL